MPSLREKLQLTYRPDRVRLLFVGESPPAGGTYFYSANSNLYWATRGAFEQARPALKDADFLAHFKAFGCYLTDLCKASVNNLDQSERETARAEAVPALSDEIKECAPEAVIVVMKEIGPYVRVAMQGAGMSDTRVLQLPFPGRPEHKRTYVDALAEFLKRFDG